MFAALSYLEGKLTTAPNSSTRTWSGCVKQIDCETPDDVDLHLIADNYCTHKHEKVVSWLQKHPRFHMHFIPTSSSWMNMVERFFADLTQDCVRAGSFASVAELVEAITTYLVRRNEIRNRTSGRRTVRRRWPRSKRSREALEEARQVI